MRILRTGFVLLPLLLAACSLPTKPTSSASIPSEPDTIDSSQNSNDAEVVTEEPVVTKALETTQLSKEELLAKYKSLQTLAMQNIQELETRLGHPLNETSLSIPSTDDVAMLKSKVAELSSYTSNLTNQIVELDKRVEQRRESPSKGDLLQVHLSNLEVTEPTSFNAQPLVGNWIRGESRVVRLKENFLMENSTSEPLNMTFTETYQIIINDKLIGTFGPNRSIYELDFDAPTVDNNGKIAGSLKIRIPQ